MTPTLTPITYTALSKTDPSEHSQHFAEDLQDLEELQKPSLQPPSVSLRWMYLLCVANLGISATWALEFAITTPYFEKGLNASPFLSHSVWLVGPLSGLIIAPLVGSWSDRCTSSLGRRRPFIIAGIVGTLVGMFGFAYAKQFGKMFASVVGKVEWEQNAAIIIAIAAFCVLDLAVNTTMWPVRALQGDLVPKEQQQVVQSANQVMGSFGELFISFVVQCFEEPVAHIGTIFLLAGVFYLVTVLTIVVWGRETPLGIEQVRDEHVALNVVQYLKNMPKWLWRIGITYALGFFALFCYMPYASTWLGVTVLGGDPSSEADSSKAALFEKGVSLYGRANLVRAGVQIIYAATYPMLLRLISPAYLLGSTFVTFSILLMGFAYTSSVSTAVLLIVLSAFPMAAQFTLPVAMTVERGGEDVGKYLGALNCFAVLPQLVDTLYTGQISEVWGEGGVMRVGGAWGVLAGLSAWFVMWGV